jgi:hypothetical protein
MTDTIPREVAARIRAAYGTPSETERQVADALGEAVSPGGVAAMRRACAPTSGFPASVSRVVWDVV